MTTDTEVIIGGKVLTMSGHESRKNTCRRLHLILIIKLNEYNKLDNFKRQPIDTQHILLEINIADDYFKARNKVELLEQDLKAKENELYDLKHELIATQIKLENTSKSLKEAQDEINLRTPKVLSVWRQN